MGKKIWNVATSCVGSAPKGVLHRGSRLSNKSVFTNQPAPQKGFFDFDKDCAPLVWGGARWVSISYSGLF